MNAHVYAWVFLSVFTGFPTTALLGKKCPRFVLVGWQKQYRNIHQHSIIKMRKLFIVLLSLVSSLVAADDIMLIYRNGKIYAISTEEVDSVTFTRENLPDSLFAWGDTVYINDTIVKQLLDSSCIERLDALERKLEATKDSAFSEISHISDIIELTFDKKEAFVNHDASAEVIQNCYIQTAQINGAYNLSGYAAHCLTIKSPIENGAKKIKIAGTMIPASLIGYVLIDENGIVVDVKYETERSDTYSVTIDSIPETAKSILFCSRDYNNSDWDVLYLLDKYSIDNHTAYNDNILYGKKWCVVGDSFSAAISSDYEGTDEKLTYVDHIKQRNNMVIQNFTMGGRTMAYPADGSFTNAFAYNLYKKIDSDVDYITIYLGINDAHHADIGDDGEDKSGAIPLGTIHDNTVNTFYGAWNIVLEYLIENYPFAKIGIIVTNGCGSSKYPQAEREIAQKWGIPFIDLNGDERTPAMIRTDNPAISPIAKNALLKKQALNLEKKNYHPNPAAHKFESTFIENFLRGL